MKQNRVTMAHVLNESLLLCIIYTHTHTHTHTNYLVGLPSRLAYACRNLFCSFITFCNCSSVLKSWRQLQIGQCNWLPQKIGHTGTNQSEINSLLLTGFTWKLWQFGQYIPLYWDSNGCLESQSFLPKMIGTNDIAGYLVCFDFKGPGRGAWVLPEFKVRACQDAAHIYIYIYIPISGLCHLLEALFPAR